MEPMAFKEANKILMKPHGMTDEQCSSLPIYNDGIQCISCWKMTWRERISALLFGRIWLWVVSGVTQPPVALEARKNIFTKRNPGE
jgi:hypothetical protein